MFRELIFGVCVKNGRKVAYAYSVSYTSCTSWIAVMSNKLDRTELSWCFRWVLMWQGEIPCRMTIAKCWFSSMLNRVPDKHAAGNLMFTFYQVQVSDNHEVRKWTFFSSKQSSGNQAVGNWMFWSGNNCVVHSQVYFSDNHDVTNLETHFLFMPRFLTNMLSELVLGFAKPLF